MDRELAVPRDLTSVETSDLRRRLKSELISINSSVDDEEDAEVLLDYAMDMVESGENVGSVVDELKIMEMLVCDEDAANKLGACLTKFFAELDGGGDENLPLSSVEERIEKRTESEEPPMLPASAAPSGEEEKKKGTQAQELPLPPAVPDSDRPRPARGRSIVDRAASFRSSYAPSEPPPRSSFSSVSSSSSDGRESRAGPQKMPAAGSNDEPSDETLKEEKEHELKEEAAKRTSLKDRLVAYEGASSRKFPPEKNNFTSAKDRMAGSQNGSSSPEYDNDEEGGDRDKDDDGAPAMSLKERMAAFQGGKSASPLTSTKEAGEDDADDNEEDKVIIDDAPKTMKERMAAFQCGKSSLTTIADEEEEGKNDDKDDDAPKSLKDRMSAFQSLSVASTKKEPTVRGRQSAYPPPRRENGSLQDRMSVFGKPKSAPKKQMTDVQQRMAKFNKNPVEKNKLPHRAKAASKPAVRGELKDRVAKYAEGAGVSDPDAILARPKISQFRSKRKRQSFAAKKPNAKLEARLSMFQAETMASEGETGNKAQVLPIMRTGASVKGRLSVYQASLVSTDASDSKREPIDLPSEDRAEDLEKLATEKAVGIDEESPRPETPEERKLEIKGKGDVIDGHSPEVADADSPEAPVEKELETEGEGGDGVIELLLEVAEVSLLKALEENEHDKEKEECELEGKRPFEELSDHAEKPMTEEPMLKKVEANEEEDAYEGVTEEEEEEFKEKEKESESEMTALEEDNISPNESDEDVHDKEVAWVEVPDSNASREEKTLDSETSGADSRELQEFLAFLKPKPESGPRDEAREKDLGEEREEEELFRRKKELEAERVEAELERIKSRVAEAGKSCEEIFRRKRLEVARRAEEAELESVLREMAGAEESQRESMALIQTLWKEAEERKADVRKAETNAKSLEAKMKKGGLLSTGRKVKYKNALDVVKRRELGLLRATDRLAAAQREHRVVFLRAEDCRRRLEGARKELARLTAASRARTSPESATRATDEGAADSSAGDGADDAFVRLSI